MALQQQIDQDNPAVNQARASLQNQWKGLSDKGGYLDTTTANTNQALTHAQKQFNDNQGQLKSYLTGAADQDRGAIDNRIKDYRDYATSLGHSHDNIVSNPTGHSTLFDPDLSSLPIDANVPGMTHQRGEWNAIQDVLGSGRKIDQGATWDPGQARFNMSYSPSPADTFGSESLPQLIYEGYYGWNSSDWDRVNEFMRAHN